MTGNRFFSWSVKPERSRLSHRAIEPLFDFVFFPFLYLFSSRCLFFSMVCSSFPFSLIFFTFSPVKKLSLGPKSLYLQKSIKNQYGKVLILRRSHGNHRKIIFFFLEIFQQIKNWSSINISRKLKWKSQSDENLWKIRIFEKFFSGWLHPF